MAEIESKKAPSTIASLIAGSVGGAAQVLVGQPLDTIKTRAQTAPPGRFKGTIDIASQTIRNEGFLALYKGMASPLLGVAAVNSLLFGSYAVSKRIVSPYPDLSPYQTIAAGAMAGGFTAIAASPVEMFKIRMQGQYGQPGDKKLSKVASDMWKEWGFRKGIMRGFWITVLREIPAYAGFYAGYEFTKQYFQKKLNTNNLPIWSLLTSGGMGGLAYWTACYPLDVVKSRVQLADKPPSGILYIPKTFATIARQEGLKAFCRGLTPTYLRAVPAAASTFVAFEITIDFLHKHTAL